VAGLKNPCPPKQNLLRGILAGSGSLVVGNTPSGNGVNGLMVDHDSVVTGNVANLNGMDGIVLFSDTIVSDNTADSKRRDGLHMNGPGTAVHNRVTRSSGTDLFTTANTCTSIDN